MGKTYLAKRRRSLSVSGSVSDPAIPRSACHVDPRATHPARRVPFFQERTPNLTVWGMILIGSLWVYYNEQEFLRR